MHGCITRDTSNPPRARRPTLVILTALVVFGTSLLSPLAPAVAVEETERARPAERDRPGEVIVTHQERMGIGDAWRPVPRLDCPSGMHVSSHPYSERPSWNIPFGVEIVQETHNILFGVDIWPAERAGSRIIAVGGGTSTISNWFGTAQTVTIRVHCTR